MLLYINKFSALKFSELMNVYKESNIRIGSEEYPDHSPEVQLINAESDFYNYLKTIFFPQPDSYYAIWEEEGRYKAALRLEPYADGFLLSALETAPEVRDKGCATALINAVLEHLRESQNSILYSHVAKSNIASLYVHRKCGFQIIKNYAVHSDGSVFHNSYTMAITLK